MKYLLAVDASEYSDQAVSFLARLPLKSRDEVHLLHVLTEPGGFGESYDLYDELMRVRQKLGEKILAEAAHAFKGRRISVTTRLEQGYPYQAIISTAGELGADLVVMGSRGHSAVESFLLGSMTRQVVIHASMPVLAVRPPQKDTAERPLRILFAADASDCSRKAGTMLMSVPFPQSSELTVLHAVDSPMADIPERFYVEVGDQYKETVARVRQDEFSRAEALVEEEKKPFLGRFESLKTLVKPGEASAVITEQVAALGPDLLVVGCRGTRGVAGMLGSVARRVLSHARCSVLVGKLPA